MNAPRLNTVHVPASVVRDIMHALAPLLRHYDKSDVWDGSLDNEQPVPELRGVLLGHLRAAERVRRSLGMLQ